MKPLYEAFLDAISGRAKTHLYRIFLMWIIVLHIDAIYFAFFVDQNLVFKSSGVLKNEYLLNHYFAYWTSIFWFIESIKIIIALIITVATVWIFPRLIGEFAYAREVEDDERLQMIKIKSESKIQKQRKSLADTELQIVQSQENAQQKQESIVRTEQDEWSEEYAVFKKSNMFSHFDDIIDSIIDHYGRIRQTDINQRPVWEVDKDLLAYATSNDLVELDQKDARITLTPKGKYFMKIYQLETQTD